MKRIIVLLLLASAVTMQAQIGLEVILNRGVYMRYEAIYAQVTIRNDSGRPLLFGRDPELQGFILFDIRNQKNQLVPKKKGEEINVTGLLLRPGETKRMILPLHKYYQLDTPGSYKVNVYISHNSLADEYQSKDIYFRVDSGSKFWSKTVGVPDLSGKSKGPARERTYSVRFVQDGRTVYYYLVIEDNHKIFGVCRLGTRVQYEELQAEVDMLSRIHLLIPLSPRIYHYLAFSLDGLVIANTYWKTSGTVPALFRDSVTGKVTRIGGVPARPGIDFIDPKSGMLTASKLLEEKEQPPKPKGRKDPGRLDLGKDL